tara:strand:- start:1022 stop:1801 length:780 start_codon:yes stop_codon:yes gene_type:complete
MTYKFIEYKKEGKLVFITIIRPERLNALHPPANQELLDAFNKFKNDDSSWIAILTGSGNKSFSAGNDLRYAAENEDKPYSASKVSFGGITSKFQCVKPIIAAVNGYALGGGLELAMACDIIIMSNKAVIGLPEPRVGFIAGAGGIHKLPRQIPFKRAMGMILTGKKITAQEAYELGLVNEIVDPDLVMDTAKKWASEILECAPLSIRVSKQMAYEGLKYSFEEAMEAKYSEEEKYQNSSDHREGPKAFSEKRKPNWTAS